MQTNDINGNVLSNEWYENQRAQTRKQGFVIIKLDGKTIVDGTNSNDSTTYLKELHHKRSFDPIGFSLPINNVTIDLYNYNDKYLALYESFNGERRKIVIQYGYHLDGGDVVIQGGVFYTSDIQLNDDVVSIIGSSTLEMFDENISISNIGNLTFPTTIEIGSASNRVNHYEIDPSVYLINFNTIINEMKTFGINFITNTAFDATLTGISILDGNVIDTIQRMSNVSLHKCIIDRQDNVCFFDNEHKTEPENNYIMQINSLEKPKLSTAKSVKSFEISSPASLEEIEVTENSETGTIDMEGFRVFEYNFDWNTNRLISVGSDLLYPTRGYTYLSSLILDKTKITIEAFFHVNSGWSGVDGKVYYNTSANENIIFKKTIDKSLFGEKCDIENPIGTPLSPDKIYWYFQNREFYSFYVRGNPARDVGDYVWVSLTDDNNEVTYKKGLVLESELIFDGSFKEELTVRIIDNEYEESDIYEGAFTIADENDYSATSSIEGLSADYAHIKDDGNAGGYLGSVWVNATDMPINTEEVS